MPNRTTEGDVASSRLSLAEQDAEIARRGRAWALGILAIGEVGVLDRYLASRYHWPLWVELGVDAVVLVSTGLAIRRMLKQPLAVDPLCRPNEP